VTFIPFESCTVVGSRRFVTASLGCRCYHFQEHGSGPIRSLSLRGNESADITGSIVRILQHRIFGFIVIVISMVASSPGRADGPSVYDRVSFSTNATSQVENDNVVAIMYYERQGNDLAALANDVNRKISAAVDRCKAVAGIAVRTLGYQTNRIYDKDEGAMWRVRQSMRLQSETIDPMIGLLGELQAEVALEFLNYTVSESRRAQVEDQLTGEAIAAFQARAAAITRQLGRKDYRLVSMNISGGGDAIVPQTMRTEVMALSAAVAPPAVEPGTTLLRVDVGGIIEVGSD
jgi:predicted secreted protein